MRPPRTLDNPLDYQVSCECGNYVSVSEGAAGALVECSCGRSIRVPSLDKLREQEGLPVKASATLVIQYMLAQGELPSLKTCARCHSSTTEMMTITVECEKAETTDSRGFAWVLAILISPWFLLMDQRRQQEYGRNLIMHLPARICRNCQIKFIRNPESLKLNLLATLLAVAGLVWLIGWSVWGWSLISGALALSLVNRSLRKRYRNSIRIVLEQERHYERLLEDYPDANLLIATEN